jgi:ribosomal protein S12 methylthiotransferase
VAVSSKINVITLGCPKNLVDSEFLLAQLDHSNARLVDRAEDADTVIINTCGFIQDAKKESIDTIMNAVALKNRGELKRIIVMGCLSARYKEELAAGLGEVDAFFGTDQHRDVLRILGIDYKSELLGERRLTTPSHYAYLKISEGCDNPCSFCAIPLIRGRHRSRPIKELIHEAQLLAEKGVKEIIIVAQDTTYFGLDIYGERQLPELLGQLSGIDGIEWIRLMYTYPAKFPYGVIEAFQNYPKICRYLDIPIQHISDNVLKSMRRGTSKRAVRELLMLLKNEIPGIALRTTIIVGYPDETEDDFEELCGFIEEMQFHRLGVFIYSHEEGTASYNFGDPIPAAVKQERQAILMEIQKEISEQLNRSIIGKEKKVLIDSRKGGYFVGRTEWDAPEIDQEVLVTSDRLLKPGGFYSAVIMDAAEYDLYASVN